MANRLRETHRGARAARGRAALTTEAFVNKVVGDTVGLTNTVLAFIGDELGLWKDLAAQGPATSAELARRTGLAERPVREWLHAMTAAGYLERCKESHTFAL